MSASNNPTSAEKQRWLNDPVLMASCVEFFRFTLAQVKPMCIIALGTAPAAFVGRVFAETLAQWRSSSWRVIDEKPYAVVTLDFGPALCFAMTHPSMSNAHQRLPEFRNEANLLKQALATIPS